MLFGFKCCDLLYVELERNRLADSIISSQASVINLVESELILERNATNILSDEVVKLSDISSQCNFNLQKQTANKKAWKKATFIATIVATGEAIIIYSLIRK